MGDSLEKTEHVAEVHDMTAIFGCVEAFLSCVFPFKMTSSSFPHLPPIYTHF